MGRGLDGLISRFLEKLCSFEGPLGLAQFPVAIAWGKHLFPFRTEQLSPTAPMVLGSQGPGRVGRRRFLHRRAAHWAARRRSEARRRAAALSAAPGVRGARSAWPCGGARDRRVPVRRRCGYAVHGPLRDVVVCHCSRCRRTHGHVAAYAACARADLELAGGCRAALVRGRRPPPRLLRGAAARACSGAAAGARHDLRGRGHAGRAHRPDDDRADPRRRRGRLLRRRRRGRPLRRRAAAARRPATAASGDRFAAALGGPPAGAAAMTRSRTRRRLGRLHRTRAAR